MFNSSDNLKNKKFLIYGYGKTGFATCNYLKKNNTIFILFHYLNFKVAKPIIAKIIEIIQNLITTVDSGQPFFSK